MPIPVLWCKLENDADVINPTVPSAGGDGEIIGALDYELAKFNNGVKNNSSTANYARWPDPLTPAQINAGFAMEGTWVACDPANVDACLFSLSDTGTYETPLAAIWNSPDIGVPGGSGKMVLYSSAYPGNYPGLIYAFTMPSFSIGDKIHVAALVNAGGAAGARLRLFVNNVEISPSVLSDLVPTYTGGYIHYAYTGWRPNGWSQQNGIIDNIKLWDYLRTDYSGYLYEDGNSPVQQNLTASQGTYSDHIATAWDAVSGASAYNLYRTDAFGAWRLFTSTGSTSTVDPANTTSYYFPTVVGTTYYYKVASVIGGIESGYSSVATGWLAPVGPVVLDQYFNLRPKNPDTSFPSVKVAGLDIWKAGLMSSFTTVEHQKSFQKDRIILAELQIEAFNKENIYSLDNPKSMFHNVRWRGSSVRIFDPDGNKIWDGGLYGITRDYNGNKITLDSKNYIFEDRYGGVTYSSADWETGADAFENICAALGIKSYDKTTLDQSRAYLQANNCYLKVSVVSTDHKNIMDIFETVAKMSNADLFDYAGKIYFRTWLPRTSLVIKTEITDADIIESPVIGGVDRIIVNDYNIPYDGDGGTHATDSANNNIGELSRKINGVYTFKVEGDQYITLKDKASAVFIGESAIRQKHRTLETNPQPLMQAVFSITMEARIYLDLKSYFALTFKDEGWDGKTFEVFGLKQDYEKKIMTITAYETPS